VRKKEEERSRISSKSRISHEFVSCTISLISPPPPLTNHYPTLPSTIDKNVTVRFYPWPHHPRGYYPPSRTTPSCHSSPRSSLPLFPYTLPAIRGVELILWLYRFHKLSVCRFAPHSTISPLVYPHPILRNLLSGGYSFILPYTITFDTQLHLHIQSPFSSTQRPFYIFERR